jgi:hypothetical protein
MSLVLVEILWGLGTPLLSQIVKQQNYKVGRENAASNKGREREMLVETIALEVEDLGIKLLLSLLQVLQLS